MGSGGHDGIDQVGKEAVMSNVDVFRPRTGPAQAIYDAFRLEAQKRSGRAFEAWVAAERQAVWSAARDAAQQAGLPVPTMEEVERAEVMAQGHVDYGSKWAYGVVEAMHRAKREQRSAVGI